jgi:DNA-binding NarL/FixJ family response regulator
MKLLLADRRPLFREALTCLLVNKAHIEVVDTCGTGAETIDKTIQLRPDVVIVDTELKGDEYVEVTRRIHELVPDTKILVLSHSEQYKDLLTAIGAGAVGYLSKDITFDNLVNAITLVAEGGVIMSPPLAIRIIEEFSSLGRAQKTKLTADEIKLSHREREVLALVANGTTNKQVANKLFITENTVKAHLRNVMEKLHVHTRLQVALIAKEKGLVEGADTGAGK